MVASIMRSALLALVSVAASLLSASEGSTVLSVTATDDGLPSASLLYQWSLVSGPSGAAVRLATATAATTAVTLDRVGTYRFQVAISDGALTTTGAVQVEAVSAGSGGGSSGGGGGGGGCGLGSIAGALGIGALLLGLRRRR